MGSSKNSINIFIKAALLATFLTQANTQRISPCPGLFAYEPQKENDRWYGVITLMSESDLSGVWLRVILDRPSLQLGNWFGEIKSTDNKEYLIKNPTHELKANMPYSLRFYIRYNPADPAPQLIAFRLNAKTVCPEGTTLPPSITGGKLQTSNELSSVTTPMTPIPDQIFSRPGTGWSPVGSSATDDDEAFVGDFQLINKTQLKSVEFECGTVVAQPKPLITYGQSTKEGEFPWHAALYHALGANLQYICGASLISNNHVLTVAHCVTLRKTQNTLSPESLVVYLGKYYLKKWSNPGIYESPVSSISVHPDYNSQTYANDIALIKLAKPIRFTDYVRPICLWSDDTDINSVLNKPGTVVGWGFDHTGKVTEELTRANMPVVSKETCIYSFPDFFSRFTTTKTFCAGFRNGTSVCNGDSGGGMVFPKSTSSTTTGKIWQLRGLVSISVALQDQFRCDSSHYVVFTDVAKYLNWIKASMQK